MNFHQCFQPVIINFVLILGLVGCSSTMEKPESQPTNNLQLTSTAQWQDITPNKLWISSFPEGVMVYLLPDSPLDANTLESLPLEVEHFLGFTPVMTDVDPGQYLVVVVISAIQIEKEGFWLPLEPFPFRESDLERDGEATSVYWYDTNQNLAMLGRIYRIKKEALTPEILISILVPQIENETHKPYLYPSLDMVTLQPDRYTVTSTSVINAIENVLDDEELKNILTEDLISDIVKVLQKVGKVKLQTDEVGIIVQIKGDITDDYSIQIIE